MRCSLERPGETTGPCGRGKNSGRGSVGGCEGEKRAHTQWDRQAWSQPRTQNTVLKWRGVKKDIPLMTTLCRRSSGIIQTFTQRVTWEAGKLRNVRNYLRFHGLVHAWGLRWGVPVRIGLRWTRRYWRLLGWSCLRRALMVLAVSFISLAQRT